MKHEYSLGERVRVVAGTGYLATRWSVVVGDASEIGVVGTVAVVVDRRRMPGWCGSKDAVQQYVIVPLNRPGYGNHIGGFADWIVEQAREQGADLDAHAILVADDAGFGPRLQAEG